MKTVLITGASGGIGRGIALKFAENGYNIAACYSKNKAEAEKLVADVESAGGRIKAFSCDVKKENEVERLFEAAEKEFGFIDVLVNSAGVSKVSLFQDLTLDMWNEIIATNLTSIFLCCRRAAVPMIREKRGAIINIGSIWGETGASLETAYSASKAGVSGFSKALSKELGPSGITVNCIAPGWIDTKMNSGFTEEDRAAFCEEISLGSIGSPSHVGETALFLAESGYITGQVIRVDGGM